MNYLAHARNLMESPFAVVGVALPDWLRILDPRIRLRERDTPRTRTAPGSPEAEIARGLRIHHQEDRRFHASRWFRLTTAAVARRIRARFPDRPDRRMRASFFAHILVEILLDAELMRRDRGLVRAYYGALDSLDPGDVLQRVRRLIPAVPSALANLVDDFRRARFLLTYDDDEEVARRLERVGLRLRQPPLPAAFSPLVATARELLPPDPRLG